MGSRREDLEAARDRINLEIEGAEANELPGLVRELRQVWRELEELPDQKTGQTSQGKYRGRRERRFKVVE